MISEIRAFHDKIQLAEKHAMPKKKKNIVGIGILTVLRKNKFYFQFSNSLLYIFAQILLLQQLNLQSRPLYNQNRKITDRQYDK